MIFNITTLSWSLASLGINLRLYLIIALVILMFSFIMKRIHQPYIIAYMLSGVFLGPYGLGLFTNIQAVQDVGEIGLIILMFFIGMEISLPKFVRKWRISIVATGLQIIMSLLFCELLSLAFGWNWKQVLFLGFIIAFSSSAVVIKLLEDKKKVNTNIGENVIIVLLTQDILFVPILVFLGSLTGEEVARKEIILQIVGGIILLLILLYVLWKEEIKLPFSKQLEGDHELQVFAGLLLCFGMAFQTDFFNLSPALGAFIGGIIVHAGKSTKWLHHSLHSFRVVLVSIFFISIGILIDLDYLMHNWVIVTSLVILVFLTNHGINTLSLKSLGNSWTQSLYGGGLLAQIGELSFIVASVGRINGVLGPDEYSLTILVISVTIFLSPFWISLTKRILKRYGYVDEEGEWLEN